MHRLAVRLTLAGLTGLVALPVFAQQPAQPQAPAAYTPSAEERKLLDEKQEALKSKLKTANLEVTKAADAVVFLQIARMADSLQLYTKPQDVADVARGLDLGVERVNSLIEGKSPWRSEPGRHLLGYQSRVDGSVQPYGVTLPAGFDASRKTPTRLDLVLHGRGPTEVTFLRQMEPVPGSKNAQAPEQPFIQVEPFGRGNNGWRWAGESDVLEVLAEVKKQYSVDENRTILRGFSMGGHGAWHMGVHHPGLWSAVSPGAGFSDTRNYLKLKEAVPPYQEAGWHIYDAVDYALNLSNTLFVGYGGDKDPQLQATLNMKEAAAKEGLDLQVIIGPNTAHAYEPRSLQEIMRQVARPIRKPDKDVVRFTTWTLKYAKAFWVTVDGMGEHYKRATVNADATNSVIKVQTDNVTALTLDPRPKSSFNLQIDGQLLTTPPLGPLSLERQGTKWKVVKKAKEEGKHPGQQGPIDDAFTNAFRVIGPSGPGWSEASTQYSTYALERFRREWRFGFRAELPMMKDTEFPDNPKGAPSLILFGDPSNNRVMKKVMGDLPIKWTANSLEVNGKKYDAEHVPVLVFPNPYNPRGYVVINSGHTFNYKDLEASNANLFPKLPDWAVIKVAPEAPQVVAADYFDENWKFKK